MGHDLNEIYCLDLFSGTGALGLEALSRGAKRVTFVEQNKKYLQKIKNVYFETSEKEDCEFYCEECLDWVKNNNSQTKYDLIFVDPPFNKNLIEDLINSILEKGLLSKYGRIYFEFEKKLDLKIPKSLSLKKKKSLGRKSYVLTELTCLSS